MTDVAFGLFDHLEQRAGQAPHDTYAGRIRLVQAAEQAGFHAYQVAEHHFTPLGLAPSPSLFLAALAPVTQRIRLGSLVHLLPLYTPVRLIEEICMLDQLSGGRLELGIGRGVSPFELGHYGVDFLASRDSFEETLTALIAGLTQPQLHARGAQFRYRGRADGHAPAAAARAAAVVWHHQCGQRALRRRTGHARGKPCTERDARGPDDHLSGTAHRPPRRAA